MNKKIRLITVISMLLSGVTSFAQISISAGYVNSTLRNAILTNDVASNLPYKGFYSGVSYTFHVMEGLSITPGVYFESVHANLVADMKTYVSHSFNAEKYISAPMYACKAFELFPGARFLAFAGPTVTIGLSSVNKSHRTYRDIQDEVTVIEAYAEGYWKRIDVMVGGGVGIEILKHIRLTFAVNYGLIDRQKIKIFDLPIKRKQLVAGVAYVF